MSKKSKKVLLESLPLSVRKFLDNPYEYEHSFYDLSTEERHKVHKFAEKHGFGHVSNTDKDGKRFLWVKKIVGRFHAPENMTQQQLQDHFMQQLQAMQAAASVVGAKRKRATTLYPDLKHMFIRALVAKEPYKMTAGRRPEQQVFHLYRKVYL